MSPVKRLLALLLVLVAVGIGAAIRIHTTLDDPNFDAEDARPLLRSDPGLLFYITERIVDGGGLPPADFSADPRIEHPATSDIPAMFTVGQEFLVAWCWLLFGEGLPLHLVAVWVMGLFASLAVIGVCGLTWELTERLGLVALAAAVYLLLLANFRTIGFILIREDFSLPWFSLHLYLFARALRVRTGLSIALAAAALVLAAGTWHAMGFMLTIEAVVVLGWYLRSGENPLAAPRAWWALVVIAAGAAIVPVLRAKGFLFSLPVLVLVGLWVAALLERGGRLAGWRARLAAPVTVVALLVVTSLLGARGDYAHVIELMSAKLSHAGELPADPGALSFDTRLLWQGPFATATWDDMYAFFGAGLLLLGLAAIHGALGWLRGHGDSRVLVLMALVVAATVAAVLVRRTAVLPALLAPVVAACAVQGLRQVPLRAVAIVLFLAYQVHYFYVGVADYQCPWYRPPERGKELAEVVRWAEVNIPATEPIAADFETSTALLAHGRHPMLVQPKYETTSSRRRIEEFSDAFLHGSLLEYGALLAENDCRYVLANRAAWGDFLYVGGIRRDPSWRPDPSTPFFNFCHPNAAVYENLPGFRLVFRSADQLGPGNMRVFERVE